MNSCSVILCTVWESRMNPQQTNRIKTPNLNAHPVFTSAIRAELPVTPNFLSFIKVSIKRAICGSKSLRESCIIVLYTCDILIHCYLLSIMPVTDVQETCTRNLYKLTCTRNLHVCHSNLQQNFSCANFLHSRASFLCETEHVLFDARNLQSCDSMHTCWLDVNKFHHWFRNLFLFINVHSYLQDARPTAHYKILSILTAAIFYCIEALIEYFISGNLVHVKTVRVLLHH